MKLLSLQPGYLYQNGGASRVLRRLYKGREDQVISLGVITNLLSIKTGDVSEIIIPAIPLQQTWMRWFVRDLVSWLRNSVFKSFTINRIRKAAAAANYDTVHIINHGSFLTVKENDLLIAGKKLWVSFHDYFSTSKSLFTEANALWNMADRRLMISEELGLEYQKLFGEKDFEIITDGVAADEISNATEIDVTKPIIIYFAGLLHIDYYPLLNVLAEALDLLTKQGFEFSLVLRGMQVVDFLNDRSFKVEYRSDFVSDQDIKTELDEASILYLPIKFTLSNFYLYSLSTKMIGYLGASGSILYHGPQDAAACNLLKKYNSAVCCTSNNVTDLVDSVKRLIDSKGQISANAKLLARDKFDLAEIQKRFWQVDSINY